MDKNFFVSYAAYYKGRTHINTEMKKFGNKSAAIDYFNATKELINTHLNDEKEKCIVAADTEDRYEVATKTLKQIFSVIIYQI